MSRPYLYFFNTNGAIITVINIAINKRGKIIRSRIGLQGECEYVEDFLEFVKENGKPPYDAVIVDEVQFLSRNQIDALSDIVDDYDNSYS